MAEYLIQNGFGGTALTKRIPEWVHATPTDQRLAFLAGYLDADGTVSSGLNTTVTSANLYLLQDAHRLARSCGLGATAIGQFTTETPSRSIPVGVAYRFGITGDCARIPCRDPRKRLRLAKRRYFQTHAGLKGVSFGRAANHWVGFAKVEAIAELGPCPSVAIALDGATNFVAEPRHSAGLADFSPNRRALGIPT
ncbi:MAG: LAGLIDADG family homing endonuclease [Chloroflexi bacterium]|nr:LAGLIDADG family homing endonuclease [Chloroflexota bacterium]